MYAVQMASCACDVGFVCKNCRKAYYNDHRKSQMMRDVAETIKYERSDVVVEENQTDNRRVAASRNAAIKTVRRRA